MIPPVFRRREEVSKQPCYKQQLCNQPQHCPGERCYTFQDPRPETSRAASYANDGKVIDWLINQFLIDFMNSLFNDQLVYLVITPLKSEILYCPLKI